MTIMITLYNQDVAKAVCLVKSEAFKITNSSVSNAEPIRFPPLLKGSKLTHVKVADFLIPLSHSVSVMAGDFISFPAEYLNITIGD